jgi:hypothetical protein
MARDGVQVQVTGADELVRTLARAGDQMDDFTAANMTAGQVTAAAASRRAPRRTGRLAGSIKATTRPNGAEIGSTLIYANPIHWGWPARNIRPNPFLTTAFGENQPRIVSEYSKRVESIIDGVRGA